MINISAHKKDNKHKYIFFAKGWTIVYRRHKNKFLKDLKRFYKDQNVEVTIHKVKR